MKKTIRKLLALALVLAMAMMSIPAFAEEQAIPAIPDVSALTAQLRGTADLALNINPDFLTMLLAGQLGGSGSAEQLTTVLGAVGKLINNLSLRFSLDGTIMKAEALLKDASLADISVGAADGNATVTTSLIPDKMLSVSMEEIQQKLGGAGVEAAASSESRQKLLESLPAALTGVIPHLTTLFATVTSRLGEAETGAWTLEETEFQVRQPLNMTFKELAAEVMKTVKSIQDEESVQQLIQALGNTVPIPAVNVDEALENFAAKSDDEMPKLETYFYSNQSQNFMLDANATQDDQALTLRFGSAANGFVLVGGIPNQLDVSVRGKDAGLTANVKITQGQQIIEIEFVEEKDGESGFTSMLTAKMGGMEIVSLLLSAKQDPSLDLSMDTEGKTALSFSDLTNPGSEAGSKAAAELQTAGQTALIQILMKVQQAMPDEYEALTQLFGMGAGAAQ